MNFPFDIRKRHKKYIYIGVPALILVVITATILVFNFVQCNNVAYKQQQASKKSAEKTIESCIQNTFRSDIMVLSKCQFKTDAAKLNTTTDAQLDFFSENSYLVNTVATASAIHIQNGEELVKENHLIIKKTAAAQEKSCMIKTLLRCAKKTSIRNNVILGKISESDIKSFNALFWGLDFSSKTTSKKAYDIKIKIQNKKLVEIIIKSHSINADILISYK